MIQALVIKKKHVITLRKRIQITQPLSARISFLLISFVDKACAANWSSVSESDGTLLEFATFSNAMPLDEHKSKGSKRVA